MSASQQHALRYHGAAHDGKGRLINPDTTVTSGKGRALCMCGQLSEELPSGGARKRWFKDHKAAAEDTETTMIPVVSNDDDLIGEVAPGYVDGEVEFTTQVAKHFWRSLGRRGTRLLVERLFPNTSFTPDNARRVAMFHGPRAEVEAALIETEMMWAEAAEAFKTWQKNDPTYLALPKVGLAGRQASFALKEQFLNNYTHWYVARLEQEKS